MTKDVTTNNIIDISMPAIKRKRIRINGDDSSILELNTSDMMITARLEDAYPKLNALLSKAAELSDEAELGEGEDIISKFNTSMKEIDSQMRELVDYIFDAEVSKVCCGAGSMYDPFNGSFRYEIILETLFKLYEENLNKEFQALKKKVNKYAKK